MKRMGHFRYHRLQLYDGIEIKSGCSYSRRIKWECIRHSIFFSLSKRWCNRVADKRNWAICLAYRDRSDLRTWRKIIKTSLDKLFLSVDTYDNWWTILDYISSSHTRKNSCLFAFLLRLMNINQSRLRSVCKNDDACEKNVSREQIFYYTISMSVSSLLPNSISWN